MEPHDTGPVAVLFPHDPLCSFVLGPLDPHLQGARSAGADLAPPHLPGHGVEIVERGLLPVDIQPACAGDRDLLTLTRVPQARRARMVCESIVTHLIQGHPCWRTATVPGHPEGLLALNGLRVPEATGASIQDLAVERGHRTPVITRKGGKVVIIPLASRTARAIDLAVGERMGGPIFCGPDGQRLDRHAPARVVRRVARRAGSPSRSGRTP